MSFNVLLVGCGITSAVVSKLLHGQLRKINITIWEKRKEPGGRFFTASDGTSGESFVDLGAQYITSSKEVIECNKIVYDTLLKSNTIVEMTHNVKGMRPLLNKINYIAPRGMASVVERLVKEAEIDVSYNHELKSLHRQCDKWHARTVDGKEKDFDIVILTMPIPEIFQINGDITTLMQEAGSLQKFCSVEYSTRYALGVFFETPLKTDFDFQYIYDNDIFRFVAFDRWKRKDSNSYSAMLHTTVQFGELHYQDDENKVQKKLIEHLNSSFPDWPKQKSVIVHQWKYSQVLKPYCSKPGAVVIFDKPRLIAGGDGFIGSTFDECIVSANKIVSLLEGQLCN